MAPIDPNFLSKRRTAFYSLFIESCLYHRLYFGLCPCNNVVAIEEKCCNMLLLVLLGHVLLRSIQYVATSIFFYLHMIKFIEYTCSGYRVGSITSDKKARRIIPYICIFSYCATAVVFESKNM